MNIAFPVVLLATMNTAVFATAQNGIPPLHSLDLSLSQLNASPKAKTKLQSWVRAGGVVVLHTDAAQLFGFRTVAPRQRTRDVAGQRFGRGEAALPFGASPLLWNATSESLDGKSRGVLGVQTVFYQLRAPDEKTDFAGDCLLSEVKGGWPLLRVCDVAPTAKPQFAAALKPFGRGFALFLPGLIENRADGEQFQKNLSDFAAQVAKRQWATLPLAPLSRAFDDAAAKRDVDFAPLVKAVGSAIEDTAPATQDTATEDAAPAPVETKGTPLLVRVEELQTLSEMWRDADKGDDNAAQASSLLLELAGRYTLSQTQDGEPVDAGQNAALARLFAPDASGRTELAQVEQDSPHAKTTRWWCGVFALAQTIAPSSTQTQGAQWPEPVLFSFARPALEAASWWQNASTEELSRVEVGKCAQAATKMAQGHKDDPPLLMAWQTQGGARWKLLLSPVEAVSDRFPADVREWGVPHKTYFYYLLKIEDSSDVLQPIGSADAMDPRSPNAIIAYNPSNRLRWQMLYSLSNLLGSINHTQESWIVFHWQPYIRKLVRGDHHGVVLANETSFDVVYEAYTVGNSIHFPGYCDLPAPTLQAMLAMHSPAFYNPNIDERDKIFTRKEKLYYYFLSVGEIWLLNYASQLRTFPARFSRMEASLAVRTWTDVSPLPTDALTAPQTRAHPVPGLGPSGVPEWMEQGLQNLASLDAADLASDQPRRPQWLVPPPSPEAQQYLTKVLSLVKDYFQDSVTSAETRSIAASPVDEATSTAKLPDDVPDVAAYTGPDLEDEDATKQMRFFLDRFGSGALTEIIQRIGSGQSPDEAMQGTIEMNQNEFFDLWRDNQDAAPKN